MGFKGVFIARTCFSDVKDLSFLNLMKNMKNMLNTKVIKGAAKILKIDLQIKILCQKINLNRSFLTVKMSPRKVTIFPEQCLNYFSKCTKPK